MKQKLFQTIFLTRFAGEEDEGFDDQKGADSVQPESGNTPLGLCKIYKRWFPNTEGPVAK